MASLGRRKSYFEFMRESIISGIKVYRPMKSKHWDVLPLAYMVKLWMVKTNPNRQHSKWLGGSAGMSLWDTEKKLQVLQGGLEECWHSRRTLGILGNLQSQNNTSFVPSSAHG